MPTISQLIGSERKRLTKKTKSPALKACPERRGVCTRVYTCLLYTSPSPRDTERSRMPSSA